MGAAVEDGTDTMDEEEEVEQEEDGADGDGTTDEDEDVARKPGSDIERSTRNDVPHIELRSTQFEAKLPYQPLGSRDPPPAKKHSPVRMTMH